MMARRRKIPRRKRLFVGCEGESEQGYVALLQRFANDFGYYVHAEAKIVTSAGDPLELVKRAAALAEQGEQGSKPEYLYRFLMLDTDLVGQNPHRDQQIPKLAEQHRINLLWQDVCFEAFLLRHFEGHSNDAPPDSIGALNRLLEVWPNYEKGMPAQDLIKRISVDDVKRAARSKRSTDFQHLLSVMGLWQGA